MTDNRFRVMLAEKRMSAAALSRAIPGMNKVCMSFITQGQAMPTRKGMKDICSVLDCKATDLYNAEELNLNIDESTDESPLQKAHVRPAEKRTPEDLEAETVSSETIDAAPEQDSHKGQVKFCIWLEVEEKAALARVIKALGYRSMTEWLREMYRQAVKQYAALNLDRRMLHELVPQSSDSPASGTKS